MNGVALRDSPPLLHNYSNTILKHNASLNVVKCDTRRGVVSLGDRMTTRPRFETPPLMPSCAPLWLIAVCLHNLGCCFRYSVALERRVRQLVTLIGVAEGGAKETVASIHTPDTG